MTFRASKALTAVGLAVVSLTSFAALPTVATPTTEAATSTTVGAGGMLQAAFGMIVVVGLIFLCAWLARRLGVQRFGGGDTIKVISSASLGQRERVVVVEISGTWLVLGVSPQQINPLHTMPAQPSTPSAQGTAAIPVIAFAQRLRASLAGSSKNTQ